ncbi:MAG: four helix bundle protein [Polyangiaceae bacterium]|nr:four helix bundle protein [Polyangiaceae bacterium]
MKAWHRAYQVALEVYRSSRAFPADERFGLTAHRRRSATSVPSNVAEGRGRDTEKKLARFLSIAARSACELEYQLLSAHDLEYLPRGVHAGLGEQFAEVKRMLYRLMQSLGPTGRRLTAEGPLWFRLRRVTGGRSGLCGRLGGDRCQGEQRLGGLAAFEWTAARASTGELGRVQTSFGVLAPRLGFLGAATTTDRRSRAVGKQRTAATSLQLRPSSLGRFGLDGGERRRGLSSDASERTAARGWSKWPRIRMGKRPRCLVSRGAHLGCQSHRSRVRCREATRTAHRGRGDRRNGAFSLDASR